MGTAQSTGDMVMTAQPTTEPTGQPTVHGRRIVPLPPPPPSADDVELPARPINVMGTIGRAAELAPHFSALGGALLTERAIPRRDQELVILRVGWNCHSVYEFGQHTLFGRSVGLTDDEIARIAGAPGEWAANDAALIAFADELCTTNDITDQTWSALSARFGDADLVELLLLAGYYRMVSGLLNSAGVELESWTPGWPGQARP
jgi:4-carboxymuconolactone decarboxylase